MHLFAYPSDNHTYVEGRAVNSAELVRQDCPPASYPLLIPYGNAGEDVSSDSGLQTALLLQIPDTRHESVSEPGCSCPSIL